MDDPAVLGEYFNGNYKCIGALTFPGSKVFEIMFVFGVIVTLTKKIHQKPLYLFGKQWTVFVFLTQTRSHVQCDNCFKPK